MKLVKLTVLTATAMLAAMGLLTASSASATPPWVVLCDAQQLLNCEANHLLAHPLPGRFLLLLGGGSGGSKLEFATTNSCESGMGQTSEVSSQQKNEFSANLESLTFTGCKGCEKMESPPVTMVLNMEAAETESWRLKINNFKIKDINCLGFGINCTFETNLNFKVQMNEGGAFADPEGAEYKLVEGSPMTCGTTFKWATGRTTIDWRLDDGVVQSDGTVGTIHKNIWPSLIAKLTLKEPLALAKQ
jgi:opacity protein-like surface antigen